MASSAGEPGAGSKCIRGGAQENSLKFFNIERAQEMDSWVESIRMVKPKMDFQTKGFDEFFEQRMNRHPPEDFELQICKPKVKGLRFFFFVHIEKLCFYMALVIALLVHIQTKQHSHVR